MSAQKEVEGSVHHGEEAKYHISCLDGGHDCEGRQGQSIGEGGVCDSRISEENNKWLIEMLYNRPGGRGDERHTLPICFERYTGLDVRLRPVHRTMFSHASGVVFR